MTIKKVLIVEDNQSLLKMYKIAFSESGFELAAASNGSAGLKKALEFQPDAILLDIMMPEMDGYEFINLIKGMEEVNPQIMVNSNLEQRKDQQKAFDQGAHCYVRKSEYTAFDIVHIMEEFNETGEWNPEACKSFL